MANPIKCKYCHVVTLEGFNEQERKYYEQGTKTMHTRERCTEAKNRGGAGLIQSQTETQLPPPKIRKSKTSKTHKKNAEYSIANLSKTYNGTQRCWRM